MKRLLQIEQLVRRRDAPADLGRIDVGIRGAHHDLDQRIDLAYALRGPGSVWTRGHAHVEECDRNRLTHRARLADRVNRSLGTVERHRLARPGDRRCWSRLALATARGE